VEGGVHSIKSECAAHFQPLFFLPSEGREANQTGLRSLRKRIRKELNEDKADLCCGEMGQAITEILLLQCYFFFSPPFVTVVKYRNRLPRKVMDSPSF